MSYLSCPYCPSQAYPQGTEPAIKLGMGLQLFRCISKHEFYVKEEREKEIVEQC